MPDIFTKQKRSEVMFAIKNKGSKIEEKMALLLKEHNIRYRRHSRRLPGKPDFYFARLKTVLFVDSCYWHGCKRHGTQPKSNGEFWTKKIERNKVRDREVNRMYKKMGWRVIRVWEHDLVPTTKKKVLLALRSLVNNKMMNKK